MSKIDELINKIKNFDDVENIDTFLQAKYIKASSVVTAKWVRYICKHTCRRYNTSLNCPPYSPTGEETQEVLDLYEDAILIQGTNSVAVSQIALKLEKIAISMELYKAISFGAGSCKLCETCNLNSCIHRDKIRPSMEACGIDVVSTVKNNGFEMTSMENGERILYEFALVLIN